MSELEQPHSAPDASDDQSPAKRKQPEGGAPSQRSKRARYISIACNECKRRKIKCNGETPCQRCGNLNLECLYAPNCCNNFRETPEFKQMTDHIMQLQQSVETLWANLNSLRSALGHELPQQDPYSYDASRADAAPQASMVIDPALNKSKLSPQMARFQGPTSSAYSFGVARSSLQHMGITSNDENGLDTAMTTNAASPDGSPRSFPNALHPAFRPFTAITKDEALRLCGIYEDEVGSMYPILNINQVSIYASLVFGLGSSLSKTGVIAEAPDSIQDPDLDVLRCVLAIALTCEGNGQSELGRKLYEGISTVTENGLQGHADLKRVQILTLIAIYHFFTDDEGMAWRVIGIAARLSIEIGLHRAETYARLFSDEQERKIARKVFWCIYVLDRRWSFGTGMSFALTDPDMDPTLPKPGDDSPYLSAMIDYSRIGSKVWQSIAAKESAGPIATFSKEEANYLDYQIMQWDRSIPKSLRYVHPKSEEYAQFQTQHPTDPESINASDGRALHRLRVLLYLRLNQMKILIYRPVLYSATQMMSNESGLSAQEVVEVAKDTIQVLTKINQSTDIYRTQQVCFHHFLSNALAVIFLAVSHAPLQFSQACREEFYMALELVRGLSPHSHVSKRLWKTIRSLKEIGPRLGVHAQHLPENGEGMLSINDQRHGERHDIHGSSTHQDTQNDAAMAMARLSGRAIDESAFFAPGPNGMHHAGIVGQGRGAPMATSPNHMANDLTSFFEAAGSVGSGPSSMGLGGQGADGSNNVGRLQGSSGNSANAGASGMARGNEEEFSKIMRTLF